MGVSDRSEGGRHHQDLPRAQWLDLEITGKSGLCQDLGVPRDEVATGKAPIAVEVFNAKQQ